jgi:branched-chain amino acid aminotransferase
MTGGRVYVDGRFWPEEDACVPVSDRGFLYGDALFETLRTYREVPCLLGAHLDRLLGSCRELGIRPPETRAELEAAVRGLIEQTGPDLYIRIAVTRGSGYGPWPKTHARNGRTVIVARELSRYPEELYARGMKLATSSVRRAVDASVSRHKTANYLASVLARREAAGEGADEALMLNTHGRVAELSAANLFAMRGGELVTPAVEEGALPGITRCLVLELAGRAGLAAREVRMEPAELAAAEEAFATNSILEVCPVAELDGVALAEGVPGPVTSQVQTAYAEEIARLCAR